MMTSDVSKPAMEVPPEILGRILAHLEKKELKQVRLVCKKLERSAVTLLFDEVYLSANRAEIEIAQKTVRNFGKSIKTVLFAAVEYNEWKWGKFKNIVSKHSNALEYVRLAYTNYCRLRQEQEELFRAGTYFGHLCYVLRTVPNAQRLVMTDFEADARHYDPWDQRRSRLWRVGDCPILCSIQGCDCGNLEHLSYMLRPRSLIDGYEEDTTTWHLVMMGLAVTGS